MLKRCIKIECYRLWHSPFIYLSVLIGCIVSLLHFIQVVYPRSLHLVPMTNQEYPYSLFNTCLTMDYASMYPVIFLYLIPLLVVIPFGASYYQDLRSGYIRQLYIRTERKSWIMAKYMAVFLSGAVVYGIPLIFDTVLTACFIPSLIPQKATAMYGVMTASFLGKLFYVHPWIYFTIFLVIGMVYAGSLACLTLVAASLFYHSFFVLMTPVFLVFVTDAVFDLLQIWEYRILSNMSFIGLGVVINGWVCIGEMIVLFIGGFYAFMRGGRKQDVY